MMVLRKPLTAIISILVFILLLGSCTVAFSPLKLGSCCCCCYSVLKELTSPPDYCIAGFSSQESTLGGGVAHKLIVLHNGISGGFRYRSSSCKRLSLSTSVWERHRNGKSKQPRGLDFSCGAFCISTPSPSNGNHSWRLWQGVVSAVMKHIIPRVPQRTLNLIACITAAELAKKEAKVQINALPLELQPKAMVLYNDSVTLLRSYALQLTEMDWDVRRFVMQEWDAWRNRSESRMMISSFVWNDVVEPSASGPGIIARDIARLYGEAAVMGVVTRTSNISSFLESTFFRLLAQVAKTDQEALDSAVVKKLENLGVSALTVSEFFDLCSGGRIPKQIVENILRIFTEEEVIVSPSHSRDHVADGRSEICDTLTLHEMWDKLKLHSSNGQNATTRAATRAVRSLRSNSIDMVQNAVISSTEAMAVALHQFQIYMATVAPNHTVVAAQDAIKWIKTACADFSNVLEKMFIRASHALPSHPSQLLTRLQYFQAFYSAAVNTNTNETNVGGGAGSTSSFTSLPTHNNNNPSSER